MWVPTLQLGIERFTSVGANPSVRSRGRSQVWVPTLLLGIEEVTSVDAQSSVRKLGRKIKSLV